MTEEIPYTEDANVESDTSIGGRSGFGEPPVSGSSPPHRYGLPERSGAFDGATGLQHGRSVEALGVSGCRVK